MTNEELISAQKQAILDGDTEEAARLAKLAIETGTDLNDCVESGFIAGIKEVGRLWAEGEYFLPELVQGADAMKVAMAILRPRLAELAQTGTLGGLKVVLATVEGDIHDIGKTLVATVLEANGFEVFDLGRDVSVETVIDKAVEVEADLIGLSALLTTTMPVQQKVIERLEERDLRGRFKVMVGGAPVTRKYANDIGADGFGANAVEALDEAGKLGEVGR